MRSCVKLYIPIRQVLNGNGNWFCRKLLLNNREVAESRTAGIFIPDMIHYENPAVRDSATSVLITSQHTVHNNK